MIDNFESFFFWFGGGGGGGGFRKKSIWGGGDLIVDIFGGSPQNWTTFGVISIQLRVFLKVKIQKIQKYQIYFWGMPGILGLKSRCGSKPTERPPTPLWAFSH